MTLGLDHVQVIGPPGCEEAARGFYAGVLGLEEVPKARGLEASGGCWFALAEGRELHVGVEEGFSPAPKAHPGLLVPAAEWDALLAELARAGVAFEPDERMAGVARGYVRDPFGNRLELRRAGEPASGGGAGAGDRLELRRARA